MSHPIARLNAALESRYRIGMARCFGTVLAALLFIALSLPASGQGYPPTIAGATVRTYKTVKDVELKAWILVPDGHQATDSRPAMVFFFGGGWVSGSPAQFERQAQALRSRGMVAVLADYRVLNRHNTKPASAVEDAKSAIRWVRRHAGELGVDPNRIGAAGGSAGGHLAATTATLPSFDASGEDLSVSSVPNALVLFNPVVIVAPVEGRFSLQEGLRARMAAPLVDLSPYHHLRAGLPPTLIMHGANDELVPVATVVAYCERAVELGNACEAVTYDGAGHGFFNNSPYFEPTLQKMLQSLATLGWIAP